MDTRAIAPLDAALRLSEQMLAAANASEWDSLSALHDDCDALLRKELPAGDTTRAQLFSIQTAYEAVRLLTESARETTASQLGLHRQNHRALNAYLQSSDED